MIVLNENWIVMPVNNRNSHNYQIGDPVKVHGRAWPIEIPRTNTFRGEKILEDNLIGNQLRIDDCVVIKGDERFEEKKQLILEKAFDGDEEAFFKFRVKFGDWHTIINPKLSAGGIELIFDNLG